MINLDTLFTYITVVFGFILTLKIVDFIVRFHFINNYAILIEDQIETLIQTKMVNPNKVKIHHFKEFKKANISLRIWSHITSMLSFFLINIFYNDKNQISSIILIMFLGSTIGIENGIYRINQRLKWRLELILLKNIKLELRNDIYFKSKIVLLESRLLVDEEIYRIKHESENIEVH